MAYDKAHIATNAMNAHIFTILTLLLTLRTKMPIGIVPSVPDISNEKAANPAILSE